MKHVDRTDFKKGLNLSIKDNRVGMGIGGFDNTVTMTHTTTGVTITLPHGRGTHKEREVLTEIMELLLEELKYELY